MEQIRAFDRKLRLCYYNTDERSIGAQRIALEKKLRFLGNFTFSQISNLEGPDIVPADLLVVAASNIPDSHFADWLEKFSSRVEQQGAIWLPALIISEAPFRVLREVLEKAVQMNWYFDIVSQGHLDSLPIRVANLLRIHDHLHELQRYEKALNALSGQLEQVSAAVRKLKGS